MTNHNIFQVSSLSALADLGLSDICIAIGIFDGVHIGHRHLLQRLTAMARSLHCAPVVLTFSPHPKAVVDPEHTPVLLLPPDRKAAILAECGVRAVVTIPFTRELADMRAEEFLDRCVSGERVHLKGLCVGRRFRCGAGGHGTADVLAAFAASRSLAFDAEGEFRMDGETVSASAVRKAAAEGDLRKVERFTLQPLTLFGTVEAGNGVAGTELNHPTANVHVLYGVLPPCGVYAAYTEVDGVSFPTALQIGRAPTFFEHGKIRVEAHLLDFSGNLYGKTVAVKLIERIRSEQKFSTPSALLAQIRSDVDQIRNLLSHKEVHHVES